MKLKLTCLFIFVIFLCWQCTNDSKPTCKYGNPEPIFSTEFEKVSGHKFEMKGQEAYENVLFHNGLKLEIIQSGCDNINQAFHFLLPGDFSKESPDFWKEVAIQNFGFLSTVSDKHMSLHHLSNSIRNSYHKIKLGQTVRLEEGYFLKIDKVLSPDTGVLILELSSSE